MCGPVSITQVEHVMLSLISKTFWASPDIGTKETMTKDTTLGTARIHPSVVVVVAVRSLAGDDEVIPTSQSRHAIGRIVRPERQLLHDSFLLRKRTVSQPSNRSTPPPLPILT